MSYISGVTNTSAADQAVLALQQSSGAEAETSFSDILTESLSAQLVESAVSSTSSSGWDYSSFATGGIESMLLAAAASEDEAIDDEQLAMFMLLMMMQSQTEDSDDGFMMSMMSILLSQMQNSDS